MHTGTLGKINKPGSVNRVHRPFAPQEKARMLKEPTQTLDGPALSEEVYHLALERIKALIGCTEDSPEERELIDWATIADTYEHSVHNNDNVTAAPALAPAAQHQHVGHERAERLLVLGPIIEERAAVEPDHVRELPGRRRRPVLRKADAAEQAQKSPAMVTGDARPCASLRGPHSDS